MKTLLKRLFSETPKFWRKAAGYLTTAGFVLTAVGFLNDQMAGLIGKLELKAREGK